MHGDHLRIKHFAASDNPANPSKQPAITATIEGKPRNQGPIMFSSEASLPERTVAILLIRGESPDGRQIYAYVAVRYDKLPQMLDALQNGTFYPEEFGIVIESGEGEPSGAVRRKMEVQYKFDHDGMVSVASRADIPALTTAQPILIGGPLPIPAESDAPTAESIHEPCEANTTDPDLGENVLDEAQCPENGAESLLRAILHAERLGELATCPWMCDVIGANAKLVAMHSKYLRQAGHRVPDRFVRINTRPRRLASLLRHDYDFLARGDSCIAVVMPPVLFAETKASLPNVGTITVEQGDTRLAVIYFSRSLLEFLHSTFSKLFVLTHSSRSAGCLPQYEDALRSRAYSDTYLLAGVYDDIESLYHRKSQSIRLHPRHISDPFPYCDAVTGVRRFLVAHEVGHHYADPREAWPAYLEDDIPLILDEAAADSWWGELTCDHFATDALMSAYAADPHADSHSHQLENALCGVLLYFVLMDIVHVARNKHHDLYSSHPPPVWRLHFIHSVIKSHEVYATSPMLQNALAAIWSRIQHLRNLAAGICVPQYLDSVWSYPDFMGRLSNYGRIAHESYCDYRIRELLDLPATNT